jgi:hypothetical protein
MREKRDLLKDTDNRRFELRPGRVKAISKERSSLSMTETGLTSQPRAKAASDNTALQQPR